MTENWKEQVYNFAGYAGYVDMIVVAIERYLKFDTSLTIRADIDKEFDNDFIEELTKKALKYYNENQKLINKRFPDDFSLRTEIIRAHLAGYDVDIKKFNIDDYTKWIENKLRNENSIPNQNIVKSTCQELGITQKELNGIRDSVLEGFMLYYKQNLESVKMSKPEIGKILNRVRELNVFEATDPKDTPEMIRQILNGELSINSDGTAHKIMSPSQIVEEMPYLKGIFDTKSKININAEEISPLFVKNFCKEQNWTYKDLAENIGSVEGTIINWMSKGSIPLWAQKSISYIVEIERLKNDADSSAYQLDELRQAWSTINDILSPLNKD